MYKLVAFEGISGSGKSHMIDMVNAKCGNFKTIKWFDNELTMSFLGEVQNIIQMNHDFFAVSYALDFYGKYKYMIEPLLNNSNLVMHRYIYTPLTHDIVRGAKQDLLERLYVSNDIVEPDLIVYMDTDPLTAYERIIQTRKPSFYECGLDCYRWESLDQAKRDYNNNRIPMEVLRQCYMDFQEKVILEYERRFKNKENVMYIKPDSNFDECVDYIISLLN